MFGFLKKKLKETVDRFSKKAEEDAEVIEEPVVEEKVVEPTTTPVEEKEKQEEIVEKDEEENLAEEEQEVVVEEIEDSEVVDAQKNEFSVESEKESKPEVERVKESPVKESEEESEVIEEPKEDIIVSEDVEDVIEPEKPEIIDAPQEIIQEEVTDEIPLPTEIANFIEKSEETPNKDVVEAKVPTLSETAEVEDVDIAEMKSEDDKPKKKGFFKSLFSKKSQDEDIVDEPEELVEEEINKDLSETKELAESELVEESSEEEIEPEESDKLVADSQSAGSEHSSPTPAKEAVHKELLDDDVKDATKKKKGFFSKIKERVVKFQLTEEAFEELFWDFELALLENNVAMEVIEKVKADLHEKLTQENVSRKSVEEVMIETLKKSLEEVLDVESVDLIKRIKERDPASPFVICVIGVNGSGKTTTIGKLIHHFQKNDLSIVVAAADTFRAAAIQQLQEHTDKLGVKLIKHDYNSDPAAVAFDAVKHATAKNIDVVLIDTAGRLQSNSNLMDELKKLIRVNKPDFNLFIGESITGNDCVEQAVAFNEAVGVDGLVLSKADIDEKGGAALSVSFVTKKPILYLGMGQTYDDLKPFNKEEILASLGL